MQNYVIEQIPTESTAGGVLLNINKKHYYKTFPDLMIYKVKNLSQPLLKSPCPRKLIWLLDVYTDIHGWIYAYLMSINLTLY